MVALASFACGMLFALGLGLASMTRPSVVRGFLDVAGAWDPRLVFVMAGAIAAHVVVVRIVRPRAVPVLAPRFEIPTRRDLDLRLVSGAALFGVGWGIAGYCPGPAVVAAAALRPDALVVAVSMVVGMLLFERLLGAGRHAGAVEPQPSAVAALPEGFDG